MSVPSKPKLADPGALIRAGKLPTETIRLCVDPDLVLDYERIQERQQEARRTAARDLAYSPSMGSPTPGAVAGAEFDADLEQLREAMEASTVELTFTALARPVFRRLVDAHPPRKDTEGKAIARDLQHGFAYEPLLDALIRVSLTAPVLDAETMELLLTERLTEGQWERLTTRVWNLNQAQVSVPFSPAVSPKTRSSSPK